jgi:hypothetical protein
VLGHHWVPGEGRLVDIRYSGHPGNASAAGQTPHFLMDVQPQNGEPYRTEVELLPLMFTFRSPGFGQVVQLECDVEHKKARFVRDDPAINSKYDKQAAKAAYEAEAQAPPAAYPGHGPGTEGSAGQPGG